MDVEVDHAYLQTLLEDKNSYIREYARLSMMKFAKGDSLQVLHELNEPISQWEEIEIFLLLQQRENFTLPSLEGLISVDKEPTIVSLCLRLAVYFKQQSSIPLIIELIQTPDLVLRAEAITALGQLEAQDAAKYLIDIYPEQPHNIRLTVLTALGKIRSARYLGFLENEFFSSTDFEIKKYASDAIIKLYPLSKSTIDKMKDSEVPLNQSILGHSLDPLINAS
jgi:HEAT repeat protein